MKSIKKLNKLKDEALQLGCITTEFRKKHFPDSDYKEIRKWLDDVGISHSFGIEYNSTEILIITPKGPLLQGRKTDRNLLGLWGGILGDYEDPKAGARKKLKEECGLDIELDKIEFVEEDDHEHLYENGDRVLFHAYRFVVVLDFIPTIHETKEFDTIGLFTLPHLIPIHQYEFIKRIVDKFGIL